MPQIPSDIPNPQGLEKLDVKHLIFHLTFPSFYDNIYTNKGKEGKRDEKDDLV